MILKGNCLDTLKTLPDCSVDSIVTDPPYELGFMGKSWDNSGIAYNQDLWAECLRVLKPGGHLLAFSGSRTYHRMVVAIEDSGFEIRDQIMWIYGSGFPKSLDVSKAIDKAAGLLKDESKGFTVAGRTDANLPNPITKNYKPPLPATPEAQQWQGWGTALKPAHEPIVVARKPLIGTVAANVLEHGTGAINIDGSRVGTEGGGTNCTNRDKNGVCIGHDNAGRSTSGATIHAAESNGGRWPANVIHDGSDEVLAGFPNEAGRFFFNTKSDYNEGLWLDLNLHPNPAKNAETSSSLPNQSGDSVLVHALNLALPEGLRCVGLSVELSTTVTANESKRIVEAVMQMTQSIGARFLPESEQPKLTLSSNHAKVVGTLEPTGIMTITASHWKSDGYAEPVTFSITPENSEHGARDSNGKSFIYCAKASKSEREAGLASGKKLSGGEATGRVDGSLGLNSPRAGAGRNGGRANFHPTVKPLALMRYLIKLVTPPGGTVLDPFLGSGTTAVAAILEGFEWIGCEMTEDYFPIIEARVEWAENQPKTLI